MGTGSVSFSSSTSESSPPSSLFPSGKFCRKTLWNALASASGLKVFFCFLLGTDALTSASSSSEMTSSSANFSAWNSSKRCYLIINSSDFCDITVNLLGFRGTGKFFPFYSNFRHTVYRGMFHDYGTKQRFHSENVFLFSIIPISAQYKMLIFQRIYLFT